MPVLCIAAQWLMVGQETAKLLAAAAAADQLAVRFTLCRRPGQTASSAPPGRRKSHNSTSQQGDSKLHVTAPSPPAPPALMLLLPHLRSNSVSRAESMSGARQQPTTGRRQ